MNTPVVRRLFLLTLASSALALFATAAEKAGKAKGNGGAAKGPERWEQTIQKFEAEDAANHPAKGGILLVGGSNARRWTDVASYFPDQKVLNRGFGGALLADVLHFADRIVIPYAPRVIILNAGGNDLAAGKTPQEVRDACRAFVRKVSAALPNTKIISISIPPVVRAQNTPEQMAGIKRTNALLAELDAQEPKLEFIDLFPAFYGPDGTVPRDLFVEDGTHFTPKGYALVAGLIKPKL